MLSNVDDNNRSSFPAGTDDGKMNPHIRKRLWETSAAALLLLAVTLAVGARSYQARLNHALAGVLDTARDQPLIDGDDGPTVERVLGLVHRGADANTRSKKGFTVLTALAYTHRPEVVRELLERGAEVETRDPDGLTPLMLSAYGGPEVARLLLAHGAAARAVDGQGRTPLHFAVSVGVHHPELVRLLCSAGADPNARSHESVTPLVLAVETQSEACVEALLTAGADPNLDAPLIEASYSAPAGVIRVLLDHGANPNSRSRDGRTALCQAAKGLNEAAVCLLLAHGAQASLTDARGDTALSALGQQPARGAAGRELRRLRITRLLKGNSR